MLQIEVVSRMHRAVLRSLKSYLPDEVREFLWRIRHIPRREAIRLLAVVRMRDLLKALRIYYEFGRGQLCSTTISIRGYHQPIVLRRGTSDFSVFGQVFLQRQYAGLPIRNPKVIIDAGANIGLASLYFL